METLTDKTLYAKSPQELTMLLYNACIEKLRFAVQLIQQQDYLHANRILQQCHAIICRLADGLNYEAGTIADQLAVVYDYLARRLLEANRTKDSTMIEEVIILLSRIALAWREAMQADLQQPVSRVHNSGRQLYDQMQNIKDSYHQFDHKE